MKELYKTSVPSVWRIMMKSFLVFVLSVFFGVSSLEAQVWNAPYCSGLPSVTQSSTYGPMYSTSSANATNRSAYIYPASQLSAVSGTMISSIYFHTGTANANGMLGTPNFKIYLKEIAAADWGTGALPWATATAGATLVFDGNPAPMIGTTGGWKQFPLIAPFNYSGTQNLAVIVEYTNSSSSNSIDWSYEYTSTCVDTTNSNSTKYSNNTTGTLPTSLSSSNYRRPYIAFDFPVSCSSPTGAAVSGATQTTVDLTWTAPAQVPAQGYEVYYSTVNTAPDATTVLDTSNSVTVTGTAATVAGLQPATVYYFWVRSKCSATDTSFWVVAGSTTTLCAPVTYMFENFDSYATGSIVPTCWVRLEPATTPIGSQTISSSTPYSGNRNIYMYASATQTPMMVILPEFSNINAGTHRLRFRARTGSPTAVLNIGYVTDITDQMSYVHLETRDITNTAYDNTSEYTVIIPSTVPANARIALQNSADAKSYYIDDVYWEQIPTCFPPTDLTITGVTATQGTVSWVAPTAAPASSYNVYYSTTNTAPTPSTVLDATNSVNSATTSAVLSSLSPATDYFVWVQSACSGTDVSTWVSAGSFTTLCVTMAAPFTEAFSSGSIPNCWSTFSTANTGNTLWKFDSAAQDYGTTYNAATQNNTAGQFAYVDASSVYAGVHDVTLESPLVDLTGLVNPMLEFRWYKNHGSTANPTVQPNYDNNQMTVMVKSSTSTTWNTVWVNDTNASAWRTVQIGLGSYVGQTVQVRFVVDKNVGSNPYFYDNILLDDVNINEAPSCMMPIGVTLANVTSSSVDLSWTVPTPAPAQGYTVYFSTVNTAPDASTVLDTTNSVTAATNTVTLSGLNPASTYYIWVRSDCAANDHSAWVAGSTFTTLCAVVTPAYLNAFDVYPGACWNEMSGGDIASGPTAGSSSSAWIDDGFLNNTGTGSARINNFSTGTGEWLISPTFDLSGGAYQVNVDYGVTAYSTTAASAMGSDDVVALLMSTDGGTTWTAVQTWTAASNVQNTSTTFTYDLSSVTSNNVKFAFYANEGTVNDAEDYNFYFDNFAVTASLSTNEVAGSKNGIKIYPNPFSDVIRISDMKDVVSVAVTDMSGRTVKTVINPSSEINLAELSSGLYVLTVKYKDGRTASVKAIKK